MVAWLGAACAKREAALPGDTVLEDGSVGLTPAPVPVAPQDSSGEGTAASPGAIEAALFPSDVILAHGDAIGLSAEQRGAIEREVARGQAEMTRLNFELLAAKEKLVDVLTVDHVDEAKSRETAGRLLAREDAIKAAHLAMLVKLKNALTSEQQAKLRAIRDPKRCAATGIAPLVPKSTTPSPSPTPTPTPGPTPPPSPSASPSASALRREPTVPGHPGVGYEAPGLPSRL